MPRKALRLALAFSAALSLAPPHCRLLAAVLPTTHISQMRKSLVDVFEDPAQSRSTQLRAEISHAAITSSTSASSSTSSSVENIAPTASEEEIAPTSTEESRESDSRSDSVSGAGRNLVLIAGAASAGIAGVAVLAGISVWCARIRSGKRFSKETLKTSETRDGDGFVPPACDTETGGMDRKDSVPWGHPHAIGR